MKRAQKVKNFEKNKCSKWKIKKAKNRQGSLSPQNSMIRSPFNFLNKIEYFKGCRLQPGWGLNPKNQPDWKCNPFEFLGCNPIPVTIQ